jgi:hypothetical protein
MVNLGVPHHIIQRYLGHKGPEMTSRYAHLDDATMHEGQTVGVSERHADRCLRQCGYGGWGQRHGRPAVVHSQRPGSGSDERLLRDPNRGWSVSTPERLPQLCALQDGCHVLEVHRAELHETERVIAKADADGWVRQSEMNARKRTSLINIVTTREASHG